jgi:hypothetical protein
MKHEYAKLAIMNFYSGPSEMETIAPSQAEWRDTFPRLELRVVETGTLFGNNIRSKAIWSMVGILASSGDNGAVKKFMDKRNITSILGEFMTKYGGEIIEEPSTIVWDKSNCDNIHGMKQKLQDEYFNK